MARHRLLAAIATTALGIGCVAALDLGSGPATATTTTTVAMPSPSPSSAPLPSTTTGPAQALDPGLVRAFDAAAGAARDAGHRLTITSGFRTAAQQQVLLNREVAKRGSLRAALRWVFTPERSMHVRGLAIDVGDGPAADWLDDHGARFGLCRTLAWEWWHFEWRPAWEQSGSCPRPVDDPANAPT